MLLRNRSNEFLWRPKADARQIVLSRLAEAADCRDEIVEEVASALQQDFCRDFLDHLVEEGVLTAIAAAAVKHCESGGFDLRDLKQVFPPDWPGRREIARFRRALSSAQELLLGDKERRHLHRLGAELGNYWLRGLVGCGAHAAVYLAIHPTLSHLVALKVARRNALAQNRLKREAEVLAQVTHPNVVRLWDYQQKDDFFLVEEWIPGPNLQQKLEQKGRFLPRTALRIVKEAVQGLQAIWRKGFVHNDLKPSNLLLTLDGQCKVIDFGVAECVDHQPDNARSVDSFQILNGTPNYAAPERFDCRFSWASDQYALGLVLYELVTGSRAFPEESVELLEVAHRSSKPESMLEMIPYLPKEIVALVEQMTAKAVEKRFASPEVLYAALVDAESGMRSNREPAKE